MDHHCEHEVSAPVLLTLPTGENFLLTRAEFAATINQVPLFAASIDAKSTVDNNAHELVFTSPIALRARNKNMELDGSADADSLPPQLSLLDISPPRRSSRREVSCASCTQDEILTVDELLAREAPCLSVSPERIPPALGERRQSRVSLLMDSKVYNEYGELVNAVDAQRIPEPADLNVTDWLRLIAKAYRHEVNSSLEASLKPIFKPGSY